MINGIHILLTYSCTFTCSHCFLFAAPEARGHFTRQRLRSLFAQLQELRDLEWIFFEGGEPFLFYPLLLEGLSMARSYRVGIVTNAYWALTLHDALLWLQPLKEQGLFNLTVSDGFFHDQDERGKRAHYALEAAKELGIEGERITLREPTIHNYLESGIMFRGRAALELTADLPQKEGRIFDSCPHEDLASPRRFHVDPCGNVHLCQGLLLGNVKETLLYQILKEYHPHSHPIAGPLLQGGPQALASLGQLQVGQYVDACHLCFTVRRGLLDRYPQYLGPKQVYGLS